MRTRPCGFTLTELLVVVAILVTVAAASIPLVTSSLDASRTWGAARYLAARLNFARSEAVKRSVFVGVRVQPVGSFYEYTFYRDGNRNGIRTADIVAQIDRSMGPPERLDQKFGGVTFGILPGVIGIDSSEALTAGSDPVRFGVSDIISFNPDGSTTAGTVYVRGRHQQAAVRLLGVTGRLRVLWFDFNSKKWIWR